MNREQAEKAARAGAKVRHENWNAYEWVTFRNGVMIDDEGTEIGDWPYNNPESAWLLVSPAPTASPDFEARLAALEEQFARHFHMTDPREDRTTPPHQPIEVGDWPDAERHLSAESLTGAMGDGDIVRAAFKFACKDTNDPFLQVTWAAAEAIRLTRASVIDEIEAALDGARGVAVETWPRANILTTVDAAIDHILKAVRK